MKFSYKTIFVLLILFTSCGNGDGDSSLPLVGTTWTEVSFEAKDCADELKERKSTCSGEDCEVFILNADGTVSLPGEDLGDTEYTYSVTGSELTLTIKDGEFMLSVTYDFEIISNMLNITIYDEDVKCFEIYTYQGS
ncbi:hypothetical protein [Ekhidna sp.]|uniref:hypothetical protein n=1 Tax=Ekhidna sp. TaxID=2608089 RepID=UPI0035158DF0